MSLKKSFSLIEVLVFITILSLFFIAAVSVVVYLVSTMKVSEHKIIATRYAEEGIEWVKSQKEEDWVQFVEKDTSGLGTTYCLNDLSWSLSGSCNQSYNLGAPAIFKREVIVAAQAGTPVTQVNIEMTVFWQEPNGEQNVNLKTVLKVWE